MLYIIVPVFNRLKNTKEFIRSLENQYYKNYTLVIVDDNSTDGTFEYITTHHKEVVLVNAKDFDDTNYIYKPENGFHIHPNNHH